MLRIRLLRVSTGALAAFALLAACDREPSPPVPEVKATDSAGVQVLRIIEREQPARESIFSLVEELRIPGSDSAGALIFGRLAGLTVDELGNIYALDADERVVLKFDSTGALRGRFAGAGAGPGELGAGPWHLLPAKGDTIVLADVGNLRVNWFDGEGDLVRELPIELAHGAPLGWGILPDGRVVRQAKTVSQAGGSLDSTVNRIITLPDAATLVQLPTGEVLDLRRGPTQMKTVLFASEPTWMVTATGRLIVGLTDRYELRIHDSRGTLERVVSLDRKPRPISSSDQAATLSIYRATMERGFADRGPDAVALVERMLANVSFAPHYPMFASMRPGPQGSVLVQRFPTVAELQNTPTGLSLQALQRGSSEWDAFRETGQYLGVVVFPDRFRPMAATGDAILGVDTDSLGVQSIVRLRARTRNR